MWRYEERGTDYLTGDEVWKLAKLYNEYLDGHKGVVDDTKNELKWLNRNGLFNAKEVKEFLDEQSDIDRKGN